jgi:hypothetical protein
MLSPEEVTKTLQVKIYQEGVPLENASSNKEAAKLLEYLTEKREEVVDTTPEVIELREELRVAIETYGRDSEEVKEKKAELDVIIQRVLSVDENIKQATTALQDYLEVVSGYMVDPIDLTVYIYGGDVTKTFQIDGYCDVGLLEYFCNKEETSIGRKKYDTTIPVNTDGMNGRGYLNPGGPAV